MPAQIPVVDDGCVTLGEATGVVGQALSEAPKLGVTVSVAVCGEQGRLVAFSKMDGAGCMTARGAIGKAVASAVSGEPSEVMPPPGDGVWTSFVEAEGTAALHNLGGLPLWRDGAQIGGVGVFGDASPERDLACATAGGFALRLAVAAAEDLPGSNMERSVVTDDASWIGVREAGHRAAEVAVVRHAQRPDGARRVPLPTGT